MTEPMLAMQHPSEATVHHALSLLGMATTTGNDSAALDRDDQGNEVTMTIGRLGTYTRKSLQVSQRRCQL